MLRDNSGLASISAELGLGAILLDGNRCRFNVWAPLAEKVDLHLVSPLEHIKPMERIPGGYYEAIVEGVSGGCSYLYRLDGGKERPDPASRFQPQGVHSFSQVVDPVFPWSDTKWSGLPLSKYILYEIHVGTFTPEGTFEAIIPMIGQLKDLGVTAIELMPVAQFPGERNWGYDGVYPFAVQNSYGGPKGLINLVDACHTQGLAVVLDVVYNHLGPEGNYFVDFGPYFTKAYNTPWGSALNFDQEYSDEVRRYFIENALYWFKDYHIDALRLDAIHAIKDFSAVPFLAELAAATHRCAAELQRRIYLIAESDRNDTRDLIPSNQGGRGLDALWCDDFHHSLHTLLTGENSGYYQDYGTVQHMAAAWRQGLVYTGQYSPFRKHRYGSSAEPAVADKLVVCAQNHDQIGNRLLGDRLSNLVDFESLKLAAFSVILSPYIPLLFMGEEYGETAPFQYFVSHSDPKLIKAVRKGRKAEFAAFSWKGAWPDPQLESTFLNCKLHHELAESGQHQLMRRFYRELILIRQSEPALSRLDKDMLEAVVYEKEEALLVHRWNGQDEALLLFNFSEAPLRLERHLPDGCWQKKLDSADQRWSGPGSLSYDRINAGGDVGVYLQPRSACLFLRPAEESL